MTYHRKAVRLAYEYWTAGGANLPEDALAHLREDSDPAAAMVEEWPSDVWGEVDLDEVISDVADALALAARDEYFIP